jgi:hypothetical protein
MQFHVGLLHARHCGATVLNFPTLLENGQNKFMTLKGTVGNMMGQVRRLYSSLLVAVAQVRLATATVSS